MGHDLVVAVIDRQQVIEPDPEKVVEAFAADEQSVRG